jgi:hypothetical protein
MVVYPFGPALTEYSTPVSVSNSNHPLGPGLPSRKVWAWYRGASEAALAVAFAAVTVIVAFFGHGESSLHGRPASESIYEKRSLLLNFPVQSCAVLCGSGLLAPK